MIDKAIGVSPPRIEQNSFSEKKTENLLDQRFYEQRSEFESTMSQLTKKDSGPALGGNKKKVQDQDIKELRSEKKMAGDSEKTKKTKEDENLNEGAVKKKVKRKLEDSEMVLINMASTENVIKIPDTEVNLDSLETTNLNEILNANATQLTEGALASEDSSATSDVAAFSETLATGEGQAETDAALDSTLESTLESTLGSTADKTVLEALNREQLFQRLETMAQPLAETPEDPVQKMANSEVVQNMNEKSSDGASSDLKTNPDLNTNSEKQLDQDDQQSSGEGKEGPTGSFASSSTQAKDFARSMTGFHAMTQTTATNSINEPNVKEILNQAQYLVTQGGGEVSVKMTPEGMGEVHLKVMLENGKMSLEMNTQDKNVQKMIQESLSDLKSSLASHQISVEHVTLNNKMNSIEAMQKSSDMQNSFDARSFSEGSANNPQQSHQRDQRQQAGRVFSHETAHAIPLAKTEMNKASAQRVYQLNKAQSLNEVA